jgi:hypothetical protein
MCWYVVLSAAGAFCYRPRMYTVVKTIRGRRYPYEQRTWRDGKHVRTESRYIGPADGGLGGPSKASVVKKVAEFIERQGPLFSQMDKVEELAAKQALEHGKAKDAANGARDAALAQLPELAGMKASTFDDMGQVVAVDKDAAAASPAAESAAVGAPDGKG